MNSAIELDRLSALIRREHDALLCRWREPQLVDELAAALKARSAETIPEALSEASPPAHGLQRVQDGFDIEEVVAEYNILRGCIHDLLLEGARLRDLIDRSLATKP